MAHTHFKLVLIYFLLLLTFDSAFCKKPKFSDQQIIAMMPSYFTRSGDAPELVAVNVYNHPQLGKVFRLEVRTNRNQENEVLGFTFSAMLNLSQYFRKPPKQFMAILHSNSHGIPPVICRGDAKCTKNHFIHNTISYEEWYQRCISFEGT